MRFLGNLIWILCGELLSAMRWWIAGLLWDEKNNCATDEYKGDTVKM